MYSKLHLYMMRLLTQFRRTSCTTHKRQYLLVADSTMNHILVVQLILFFIIDL